MVTEADLEKRTITVVTTDGEEVEIIALTPKEAKNYFAISEIFSALLGAGKVGKWLAALIILAGSTIVAVKQIFPMSGGS